MEGFPTRMLLATDGSEDAGRAALAAVDLSKRSGSELHVVHVLPQFPRYAYPGITPEIYSYVLDKTLREARELLDEQAKRIEDGGGRVAQTHTRRGPAADEILDLAEELGAGLIVVGSRGLGPVKHLILGSVSEGVVHGGASCPVLVMRGGPDASSPQRVVVGDDGSEIAKSAAEIANASRTTRPSVGISTGSPADALLAVAEEETPERTLVAVGSRGLDVTQRIRLGSVSTKVLHAAKGPVLVYPRPNI